MNEIFIYVGLRKTGGTFLFNEIFSKLKQQGYIILLEYVSFKGIKHGSTDITIQELKKRYPEAKIIMGIRDKQSWIKSYYNLLVQYGEYHSFNYWFYNLFDYENLNFEKLVEELKHSFKDVYVYDFSEFKKMPLCIKNLCDFIGCQVPVFDPAPVNVSLNDKYLFLLRVLNRIFSLPFLPRPIFFDIRGFVYFLKAKLDRGL